MDFFGRPTRGSVPVEVAADTKWVSRFPTGKTIRLPEISVYLDGLGSGEDDQAARAVVYDPVSDDLLGYGGEIVVLKGQPLGWVDFPLWDLNPGGVVLTCEPGVVREYEIGIHAGASGNTIRIYF